MKQVNILLLFFCTTAFISSCSMPGENSKQKTASPAAKKYTVEIVQMKFTPADLNVSPGDTVMWINQDMVEHNITEEAKKEWSSGGLEPGKTWSIVLQKSANYYCSIHPVMKGTVSVK